MGKWILLYMTIGMFYVGWAKLASPVMSQVYDCVLEENERDVLLAYASGSLIWPILAGADLAYYQSGEEYEVDCNASEE